MQPTIFAGLRQLTLQLDPFKIMLLGSSLLGCSALLYSALRGSAFARRIFSVLNQDNYIFEQC